jgi:hypothetical protein
MEGAVRNIFCINDSRQRSVRWLILIPITILCIVYTVSCSSVSDPSLAAITRALKNVNANPAAAAETLKENLPEVKDKSLIPILMDYLEGVGQQDTMYTSVVGRIAFYLERVSGLESNITTTAGGPAYIYKEDWERDVSQWRAWWDANKDYIYWDEQAQSLKVKPH